ncbi:MAG: zinc ribbon domain-containing protein [Oscillospiraceae bacterium]|nr:zinc ribbon domain-containing protein [Oscillospiraceae bacterium]
MAIDFLDKLAASVSRTARGASDSLRTMTDKNRINKDIAAIEHELRARYQEIGEKYYTANAENPDPEYAELFASIRELMDALDVRRRDLDTLIGTVTCGGCGKQLMKDARFCPYCGAPVPEQPAPEAGEASGVCKNCGAALAPDAVFCAACGNRVSDEVIHAEPVSPPKPLVCPNCGETLPPDAMFCAICGTKAPGID